MEKKTVYFSVAILLVSLMAISLVSAGIFDWFTTGKASADVSVGVTGSNALVITGVTVTDPIIPAAGTTKAVTGVSFLVADADGLADIVKTSFTYSAYKGAIVHSGTCSYVSDSDSTHQNYTCTGALMDFYDVPGTWTINVTGKDLGPGNYVSNTLQSFTYNSLSFLSIDVNNLTWTTTVGATSVGASNDPVVVTNQGNIQPDIDVTAKDLTGVSSSAVFTSNNFTVKVTDPACSGANLPNAVATNVTGANTAPGPSSTQPLYFCIPAVPTLPTDSYSATGGNSWEIAYV